jgi:hypothetical protein
VPVDAPALQSTIDGTVDPQVPDHQSMVCLWLDGLDRFMDALSVAALADFDASSKPEVRILATVRSEQWSGMIDGSGQHTEAARALAGKAEVVVLGRRNGRWARRAPLLTPHVSPPPTTAKPRPAWWDRGLAAVGVPFLAVAIPTLVLLLTGTLLKPAPLSDQMANETNKMLSEPSPCRGRHVLVNERVRFHSTEDDSWMIVVEDCKTHDTFYTDATSAGKPSVRSDELRIYDISGGRLRLALDFWPKGTGENAWEWHSLTAGAPEAADYDRDGFPEVIASYAFVDEHEVMLPFGIKWDNGYQLLPLINDVPSLSRQAVATWVKPEYEQPRPIFNGVRGLGPRELDGLMVQSFALAQQPNLRLLTGYYTQNPAYEKVPKLEIHASQIRSDGFVVVPCVPRDAGCPAPPRHYDVTVPAGKSADNALLEGWQMVRSHWQDASPPQVTQAP